MPSRPTGIARAWSALWFVPSVLATLILAWLGSVLVWYALVSLVGSHVLLWGIARALRREASRGYTRRLRRLRSGLLVAYAVASVLLLLPALLASTVAIELVYLAATITWYGTYRLWRSMGWLPLRLSEMASPRRHNYSEPQQREVGR